jgi:hypothetical protein
MMVGSFFQLFSRLFLCPLSEILFGKPGYGLFVEFVEGPIEQRRRATARRRRESGPEHGIG